MKVECFKYDNQFIPASDYETEKLKKLSTDEMYEIDVKVTRNPKFHRKAFAFLNYCFAHWKGPNEYQDEAAQFLAFRQEMTILAGYYSKVFKVDGSLKLIAKSLAYGDMEQDEFEAWYSAVINVALDKIFVNATKEQEAQLYGFF